MDCLFVSNWFLIPIHDSIIIKISILPVWLCCFLWHFYNDTGIGLLFQSINHSFRLSLSLSLFSLTQRSHVEHSQMTMIPIYQYNQMMVWTRICSILIGNWLLRIIKKIGFDNDTMEWFESIDIWWLFTFVNPMFNR